MKRIYTLFILYMCVYPCAFSLVNTSVDVVTDTVDTTAVDTVDITEVLTAEDLLLTCSPQIMPYLTVPQREQLIHQYKENPQDTSQVDNAFDKKSSLLILEEDMFRLQLNESTMMEVAALKDNNEIFCLITNNAPEPETSAKIYTIDWKFKKNADISFVPDFFLADTLSLEKRREALHYMEFPLYSYSITYVKGEEVGLLASISLPTLTKEEKDKIKGCFVQRNVKWSGKIKN